MPRIKFKRSNTTSAVPTTSDIGVGELALNTYDGKLFTVKDQGTPEVVEIGYVQKTLPITVRAGTVSSVSLALGYLAVLNRGGSTINVSIV